VGRFWKNYLIFYRFAGTQLEILRIKHGAMDFPQGNCGKINLAPARPR